MAKSKGKGGKKGGGKKGGKGGGGGKKGKKGKKVIDGLSTAEMSRDQLLGHIKRLQAEVDREREERNFFMLEREKLFSLWNLVLEQLAVEKEKTRLMDIHLDDAEKEKQGEMNFYKQKLRFLMAEQSKKLGQARLLHLQKMKRVQDELWEVQMIMKEGLMERKKELRQAQVSLYETIRSMHQEHADTISALRREFADEIRRMEMATERRITQDREILDADAKEKTAMVKANKQEQILYMSYMHEKQLLEMKTFFNDLCVNNLAVITSLQAEIESKKVNEQRLKRRLKEITEAYNAVAIPLADHQMKLEMYKNEAQESTLLQREFKKAARQLERNEHYARMMECANEALLQRCSYIERESSMLKKEFSRTIIEMQRKATMKRMVTELKIQAVKKEGAMCTALAKNYEFGQTQGRDFFQEFLNEEKSTMHEIRQDISDGATEFRNTLTNLQDAYKAASINLDEIGFPVKPTGAKPRPKVEKAKNYGHPKRLSSIRHGQSAMHMSNVSLGGTGGSRQTGDMTDHFAHHPTADQTPSKFQYSRSHIGHSVAPSQARIIPPSMMNLPSSKFEPRASTFPLQLQEPSSEEEEEEETSRNISEETTKRGLRFEASKPPSKDELPKRGSQDLQASKDEMPKQGSKDEIPKRGSKVGMSKGASLDGLPKKAQEMPKRLSGPEVLRSYSMPEEAESKSKLKKSDSEGEAWKAAMQKEIRKQRSTDEFGPSDVSKRDLLLRRATQVGSPDALSSRKSSLKKP